MGDNRTPEKKIESLQEVESWMRLMNEQGFSYQDVADYSGTSVQNVHARISKHIRSLPKPEVEDWVEHRIQQLTYYRKMLAEGVASGSPRHIEQAIRIDERIAKLTGSDQPDKVVAKVEVVDSTPTHVLSWVSQFELEGSEPSSDSDVLDVESWES